jgi:hypothetical protein
VALTIPAAAYGSLRSQGRPDGLNPVAPKKKKRLREQCDTSCPDLGAKIFRFSSPPNHRHINGYPVPKRGAARDRHETWGMGCGGRGQRQVRESVLDE